MPVTHALAETMKFRMVFFHTKSEIFPVGDVPDHIVGASESTGLATLTTGEVAVVTMTSFADYTQGRGPHWGYTRLTFEDGSTIDLKIEGSTRPNPRGKGALFKATDLILRGSGRYAGIQGKGNHEGRRVAPLGTGAQLYVDVTLTYNLP